MNYKVSKETALLVEACDMLNREFNDKVYKAIEDIYGESVVDGFLLKHGFNEARGKMEEIIFKFISYSIEEHRAFLDSDEI